MEIHFFKLAPSLIGVADVGVVYSDGDIEREVIEHLRLAIRKSSHTNQDDEWPFDSVEVVAEMHRFFLERGDRDEYRQKYGADWMRWYMASCDLSIIGFGDSEGMYCQLGGIHVCLFNEGRDVLTLIAPVHNVQSEIEAGTIEESCLAPFASRSNTQIAQQLLVDEPPKLVTKLASMDRDRFQSAIGHCPTRVIGYFPDPDNPKKGFYRKASPVPSCGGFQLVEGDAVVLYIPTVDEAIHYSKRRLMERIRSTLADGQQVMQNDVDSLLVRGQLLRVDRAQDGMVGDIRRYSL